MWWSMQKCWGKVEAEGEVIQLELGVRRDVAKPQVGGGNSVGKKLSAPGNIFNIDCSPRLPEQDCVDHLCQDFLGLVNHSVGQLGDEIDGLREWWWDNLWKKGFWVGLVSINILALSGKCLDPCCVVLQTQRLLNIQSFLKQLAGSRRAVEPVFDDRVIWCQPVAPSLDSMGH